MAISDPEVAILAERVTSLEMENRSLRRVAWLALLLTLVFTVVAGLSLYRRGLWIRQKHSSFTTVDAEAYMIRDARGALRGRIADQGEKGLVLQVFRPTEKAPGALFVRIYDENEKMTHEIPLVNP